MPQLYRTKFTVEPRRGGYFPIDMLRYEQAFPASESDSNRIETTVNARFSDADRPTAQAVELVKLHQDKVPHLTDARWQSFGWSIKIDSVETERVA